MNWLLFPAAAVVLFVGAGILSQKGEAPGLKNNRLKDPGSRPNSVSSEDSVQPERAVAPLEATFEEVANAIEVTGGTITSRTDDYLTATYMSRIFKFVDDVEVRSEGAICHIRSASRVGYSDNGVNRKRVEKLRATIQSLRAK